MKEYKKNFYQFQWLILIALIVGFSSPSNSATKVVKDIDYIYMHIGLQVDHPLPEEFKTEKLTFEGNYQKYTSAVYRKATNDIRFGPKRKGSGVMIIKNAKDEIIGRLHIDVQKDNLHKIAAELRDLLIAVDGIEVKIYNKKVIIDGQVLLPREMDRIKTVIKEYNSPLISSLVTYSPEAQKQIAEIIEKEIGYPEVTVRYAYNRFLLEGCVSSPAEEKRALSIANLYTQFDVSAVGDKANKRRILLLKNELSVPCESEKKAEEEKQKSEIEKLIQIVVHFVEMTKSFNKGFLFQWTPAIGGEEQGTQVTGSFGNRPGANSGITAVLTATVGNFFPKLKWAKSFGFARVLHNSSLLVKDQQRGTISIGTQVPTQTLENGTQISGGTTANVSTAVTPTIIGDRDNLIQMDVTIGVSSQNGNAVTKRNIHTVVHVRDGSSAVIGGVISSFFSRDYNKSPTRIDNPIVNLHSGKNYETSKSQFVVFVTPLIKSSASVGVDRIKEKFKLDE